jgi:hypothetical protein
MADIRQIRFPQIVDLRFQINDLGILHGRPTSADSVMPRWREISFMLFQNASSTVTLVLWPPIMIVRLTTDDFMTRPRRRCDGQKPETSDLQTG